MREIIARKIVDESGEEIIELDLNKNWPKRSPKYANHMEELERISALQKARKNSKGFITILT